MKSPRTGFTLIELLVVIAIIAVLSVVVVLSLNPAELLRQSRDANRLSDLSTLNSALGIYTVDQAGMPGFSLGNASSVYVSLPDSSSTCGSWGLAPLPPGYTYACAPSTTYRNANNSGWIPVSFSSISSGAPFGNLPLDPVNQSSTDLFYTYMVSGGSQFGMSAVPESQRQKTTLAAGASINPFLFQAGSNLSLLPFDPSPDKSSDPMFLLSGAIPSSTAGGAWGYWTFGTWSGYGHSLITTTRPDGSVGPVLHIVNNSAVGNEDVWDIGWKNNMPTGGTYTWSVWARGDGTVSLMAQWGGVSLGSFSPTSNWQRYAVTFTKTGPLSQYNYFRANGITTYVDLWLAQVE